MPSNKLTDKQCRAANPGTKMRKLFDGGGLFLAILPTGFKSWRLKYRIGAAEKQLTIGPYPQISLAQARARKDEAKIQLLQGKDPAALKKLGRAPQWLAADSSKTFRVAAMRWHAKMSGRWKPKYAAAVLESLEREVFPTLGEKPTIDIRRSDVRPIIQSLQDRGSIDQGHRVLQRVFDIFELVAVNDDDWDEDKANPASSLKVILSPITKRKYRAITKLPVIQAATRHYEAEPHHPVVKLASRMLALTAARPGTIRFAEVSEFHDLDGLYPSWIIPAMKMKLEREEAEQDVFDFEIPLSAQAVQVVKAARTFVRGGRYLFPSITRSTKPISENALNISYRRSVQLEGRHVPHGWRSTFSTIMNERAEQLERPGDRAIIDLMLAHKPQGVEAIYNRAAYMPRRRELAQEWADLLCEGLVDVAKLIEGPRQG